jgi:hypothetical protein
MRTPRGDGNQQNMRTVDALRDGIARVNRAPVILACVFLVTVFASLPFGMAIRDALRSHLGNSIVADQAARGVNVQWWNEFLEGTGTLGKTFRPSIIGFAAVLDNISAFADADARPAPLLWLGAAYLLLWLFLTGGILDRYARSRPTRSYEFFTACGVYFVRFLRLAPFMALAYYGLFGILHPMLLDEAYGALIRDVTVEQTAFLIRLALYALFAALLLVVNVIFDYAKVRAVVEDRRSMIGAIIAGTRFVRRNAAAVAGLYMLTSVLFVVLLSLYAMAAPNAGSSGAGAWLAVVIGQIYLVGRLWIRLVFCASETALFQGRLAHTGYVAGAPVARPEPASVEQLAPGARTSRDTAE